MAILQRWHIRFPGHIVSGGKAGSALSEAYAAAHGQVGNWPANPGQWGPQHEAALLQALRDRVANAGGDLPQTIGQVDAWPAWAGGSNPRRYRLSPSVGRLSTDRGSFLFDRSGLPPPPY
jgi:hypothetical protein